MKRSKTANNNRFGKNIKINFGKLVSKKTFGNRKHRFQLIALIRNDHKQHVKIKGTKDFPATKPIQSRYKKEQSKSRLKLH